MPPRTKWDSSPILVFQNENVLTVLKSFFCIVEKKTPRNFKKKKKKIEGKGRFGHIWEVLETVTMTGMF